jgi:predicted ATP-binding protein involved in virulence
MIIDLNRNETTVVAVSKNPKSNFELTSPDGKNIISTVYNFEGDEKVTIVLEKDHMVKTYVFQNEEEYKNYDFQNWESSNEIYNSIKK